MASHVCAHLGGEHSCHGRQEGAPALWGLHGGRLRVPGVGWIQAMVPLQALQAYKVSLDATCPGQKADGACRTAVHQPTGHQAQVPILPSNMTSPSSLYLRMATSVKNMTLPMQFEFGTGRSGIGSPGSR